MNVSKVAEGVHRFEKIKPSGWSLNMLVVELGGGELLLQSPTWLGDGTFEKIEQFGKPTVLLAPNHYHHIHLKRFRERYSGAVVVASPAAMPRLRKQGHQDLADATSHNLPEGVSWVLPEGLANGEIWLSVASPEGPTLLVSDAFFNMERPVKGAEGLLMSLLAITPGLRVGRTFRWVGLSDRQRYLGWLETYLREHPPAVLAVSHGEPARGSDLTRRMLEASKERLG